MFNSASFQDFKDAETASTAVHRVIKRFEDTRGIENRPRGRSQRTARTSAFRKAVKNKFNRNAARGIGKLAKENNVKSLNYAKLNRGDLRLDPYKFAKEEHLTDETKNSRLDKCRKMKTPTRGDRLDWVLFTFWTTPRQSQRKPLPKGSPRAANVRRAHFPQSLMAWAGISACARRSCLLFKKRLRWIPEANSRGCGNNLGTRKFKRCRLDLPMRLGISTGAKKTPEWCETNPPEWRTKDAWPKGGHFQCMGCYLEVLCLSNEYTYSYLDCLMKNCR